MNRLKACVISVEKKEHAVLLALALHEFTVHVIILESHDIAPVLQPGSEVVIFFKASDVVISRNHNAEISISNRLPGIVREVESMSFFSRVKVTFYNDTIEAVFSNLSANALKLQAGDQIECLIKSSDISVMEIKKKS